MNESRTIIVTGTSSGIGAYCARALKAEGWRVFATARKPEDIAALEADGLEAFYLDYREPDSIARLVDEVLVRTGGRLDALFNNGGYSQPGAVEDISVAALREQFEANFFGWHDLTTRIVPVMRKQGHGRIVHCSSIMGLAPFKYRGPYAASKHALEGLMLCLRSELQGTGIHVSLIEPGPVKSKIATNALGWFLKNVGLRELGAPGRLPGAARPAERGRQRIADETRPGSRPRGLAPRPPFLQAAAALCGDLAG